VPRSREMTPGPAVRVRPATPEDRDAWQRMRRTLWPDEGDRWHTLEVDEYFAGRLSMPLEVLIAADESGAVLGFAELFIRPYAEGCVTDRIAYLEGWFVQPHARRRGVGRALVAAAEEWGRSQGCTEFASDADLDNGSSASAHRALGFTETACIRCFRKFIGPGDDPA
jgi:aminoglycoside 6'-N-acetyltransferase I